MGYPKVRVEKGLKVAMQLLDDRIAVMCLFIQNNMFIMIEGGMERIWKDLLNLEKTVLFICFSYIVEW